MTKSCQIELTTNVDNHNNATSSTFIVSHYKKDIQFPDYTLDLQYMGSECNSIKNKRFHLITRIDLNRKNLDDMYLK